MNALQKRMEEYARNYKQKLLEEESKLNIESTKISKVRRGKYIDQFDTNGNMIATYYALKHCAKINNMAEDTITKYILSGKEYKGFVYKYSSKNDEVK